MFTGIIEILGTVAKLEPRDPGVRLVINAKTLAVDVDIGHSVSINGCCLTVVEKHDSELAFDVGPETLHCTNLGQLKIEDSVNLEASLRVGDSMGGHFVTGHVDVVGTIQSREDTGDWSTFWFHVPGNWTRHMAPKGSVAVDGISLTLVEVRNEAFSVALIPHTLNVTTLGRRHTGDSVNLETDVLAKYVETQLAFLGSHESERDA